MSESVAVESAPSVAADSGSSDFEDDFMSGKFDDPPAASGSPASVPAPAPGDEPAQPSTGTEQAPADKAAPTDDDTVTFLKRDGSTVTFKKGTKEAQAAADAVLNGQDVPGESSPDARAAAQPDAPAPAATTTPEAAPAPTLLFKANGQDYPLVGWAVDEKTGNVIVPAAHKDELLRHLGIAQHHQATFRDELAKRDQAVEALRAQYEGAQSVAEAVNAARDAEWRAILSTPEGRMQALENPDGFAAHLDNVAEKARLAAELEQVKRSAPESPESKAEEAKALVTYYDQTLEAMRMDPELGPMLSGPHGAAVEQELAKIAKVFVRETRQGKVFDTDLMAAMAQREYQRITQHETQVATLKQQVQQAEAKAAKAIEAANKAVAFNAASAKASSKQPGTPNAVRSPKKDPPKEWDDDAFLRGEYD